MRLPPKPRPPDPLAKLLTCAAVAPLVVTLVPHADAVPLGVMVRGVLEWMLDAGTLEKLFHDQAPEQYTRELTINALVRLMIQVAAGIRGTVHAAYKADQTLEQPTITTTYQAVYGKLGRLQPAVSEALVRHSADPVSYTHLTLPTIYSV